MACVNRDCQGSFPARSAGLPEADELAKRYDTAPKAPKRLARTPQPTSTRVATDSGV